MVVFYGIEIPSFEEADAQDNPLAVVHFINGAWDWYVIGAKEQGQDIQFLGLVNGFEKELGFFNLVELESIGAKLDKDFKPIGVFDIYSDFDLRY